MALVRMQKVRLIGHDSVREAVMAVLQGLGVLQIEDLTAKDPRPGLGLEGAFLRAKRARVEELERKLNEIRYVLDFIARFEPKGGLLESFTSSKAPITEEELKEIVESSDYKPIYERARALDLEPAQLRSEINRLEALKAELLPWAKVEIPIEEMHSTPLVAFVAGRLPREKKRLERLKSRIREELAGLVSFHEAGVQGNKLYIYAFMPIEIEEPFLQLAGEFGFERLPAPFAALVGEFKGSPRKILAELEQRLDELSKRREELLREAEALVVEKPKLQALYQHFHNEFLKRAAQGRLIGSENTFILEGWVRARDLTKLKEAVQAEAEEVYLEPIEPEPGERPPVVLENKPLFRPAEMVVRLFGLPRAGELDPTPFVAPFFALFFGVALTDAGYGLSLMVIFSLLKRKFKGESFRRFANLLIMGGFVALIAGALTGGWFGPELVQMLPFLKRLQLFDVSGADGLIAFLGLTMVFGFFQVLLGHLLEFYDQARAGQFKEGLFREGTWALFLLGLGLFAGIGIPPMLGLVGLPEEISPLANTLLLLGFFAVMLFSRADPSRPLMREQLPWLALLLALMLMVKGPRVIPGFIWLGLAGASLIWAIMMTPGKSFGRKLISVVKRLGSGLFRLYGATGFLGDMLSYARIMALGVATGLIAMSINTFATVLGGVLPGLFGLPKVVGLVVAALIIAVGQPFSLVINTLSAFVHSARLQYVEFFTKFYESGGDRFRPFTKEPVFYEVKE
ncbi:MAG: V-type ATP synthase subunit I [Candidatus Bipolaricaulia bacterium]